MNGARILTCPVPLSMLNDLDRDPEYNTGALILVYKYIMTSHILSLIPNSVYNICSSLAVYPNHVKYFPDIKKTTVNFTAKLKCTFDHLTYNKGGVCAACFLLETKLQF